MAEAVRLCPHCANSIDIGAAKCPYCKVDLKSAATPQWPTREGESVASQPAPKAARISMLAKIVLVAGIAALALGVYLVVGQQGRGESQLLLEAKIKELQEKEQKIQTLEADAAKTRQTLTEQTGQLSELKTKFEESQKELASARVRLGLATREVDRRSQPAPQTASRPPDPVPQPTPAPTRRAAEAGVYETIRATLVHEDPSGSSRVLSQIGPGTRINVVRSTGDWLEVKSKQGNPPGFVRQDDAKLIGRAN